MPEVFFTGRAASSGINDPQAQFVLIAVGDPIGVVHALTTGKGKLLCLKKRYPNVRARALRQ